MNLGEIKMRAAFLAAQAGFTETVLYPEWLPIINRAYVDFAWDTEFNEEQVTLSSVANQGEYTIDTDPSPRHFKYLKDVAYGTSQVLYESSEMEESRMDPLWYTRPMGAPCRYLTPRPNILQLIPKPSVTNDLIIVRGLRQPVLLAADTDVPAYPDVWHEALALKGAYYYCQAWAGQADAERISSYYGQYQGMVKDCKTYLGDNRYGTIRRLVRRPNRGRTWGNGFPRYY